MANVMALASLIASGLFAVVAVTQSEISKASSTVVATQATGDTCMPTLLLLELLERMESQLFNV